MKLTKNSIKDDEMGNINNEKQLDYLLSNETIKDYSEINSEDAFNCNKEYSKQAPGIQVRQKMLENIYSLFKKPCPKIQISKISNLKHKVGSSL